MALNFDLTDEQQMLRKMVRNFAEKEIAPVAQELDEKETFSYALTKRMGDLGLFGPFVSEEYGGSNVGYVSYIIATEEIARIDGSQAATLAAGNSLGISPIYYYGNEEQKKNMASGPLCRKGPFFFWIDGTRTQVRMPGHLRQQQPLEGKEWVINGSKIFITNSATEISRVCVVQAVTGKREDGKNEISCILVPNGTPGFETRPCMAKWSGGLPTRENSISRIAVFPKENLLGRRGDGFHQMLATLDGGRLSIAAMGLGGAQGAFELALKYANETGAIWKTHRQSFQVNRL